MDQLIKRTLFGALQRFVCYAVADYHKYWIDKANNVKNEKFTRESGYILSIKSPGNRDHGKAISYFSRILNSELAKLNAPRVDIVIVPSSTARGVSAGLEAIATSISQGNRRFRYVKNLLVRTKTIAKLAHGGARDLGVHVDSIGYQHFAGLAPVVIIFDDVCTTGNTLVACFNMIKLHNPNTTVFAVALGSTVDE